MTSRFVYSTSENVPEFMVKDGDMYRIIADDLGTVKQVVSTSTGTVVEQIDYDELGNVLADTNPGFVPFGFAGGLLDLHTRLVRFGARDYDASSGTWTTKDPIKFGGTTENLYSYAGGDPVNRVDRKGLYVDDEGFDSWPRISKGRAIGGAIVGAALSYLTEEVAKNLPRGRMRGALRMLSATLSLYSAYESMVYTALSFGAALSPTAVLTPLGTGVALFAGGVAAGAAAYNFAQALDYMEKAQKDFESGRW
jgi:RHS repeat-associated protein